MFACRGLTVYKLVAGRELGQEAEDLATVSIHDTKGLTGRTLRI